MSGFSVALPIIYSDADGPYSLNKDLLSVVKQNLKMLILTNPGERVMDTDFGVGAKKLLFENFSQAEFGRIQSVISDQVARYLPFVIVNDITILTKENNLAIDDNAISITISYFVPNLNKSDSLNIILSSS